MCERLGLDRLSYVTAGCLQEIIMPRIFRFLLCLACLATIALPAVAAPSDEQSCTKAIALAQKALEDIPAETPRDKEGVRKLKEKQEKLIAENRRKGLSECQIWGLVMGDAFAQ